ncbi:LA_2272 family surface repeat-containing protein [Aureivirga sp. CE67]|uniref:LA_2272 family surface repeat-containing protein n=1 Tax=Aureivirga sp. CE67 TaxID=1788983 RepID=UPI0018C91C70|nr:hypothetical protein [Aureivirga sp. CE67]
MNNFDGKKYLKKIFSVFLFLFFSGINFLFSQSKNILQEKISVSYKDAKITTILNDLSSDLHFDYAYNSEIVEEKKITIKVQDKSFEEFLNIFSDLINASFKYKNGFLVLKVKEKKKNRKHSLSGLVLNLKTKQPVSNVVISEKHLGKIAKSDTLGNFLLEVEGPLDLNLHLSFEKEGFSQKDIKIKFDKSQDIQLQLQPKLKEKVTGINYDSSKLTSHVQLSFDDENLTKVNSFFEDEFKTTTSNNSPFEFRPFQFSLIPSVSTNGKKRNVSVNTFSVNFILGYAASLNGAEIGVGTNVLKYNGNGVQIAGVGNIIGGNQYGLQAAGIFNITSLKSTGIQFAGFMNKTNRGVKGIQFSGFVNLNSDYLEGIQFAGFLNATDSGFGIQAGGVSNVVNNDFVGIQVSSTLNKVGGTLKGIQFSGGVNKGNVSGIQASLLNFAEESKGFQIGIFNETSTMKGFQIGIVNKADNYEKGIPIGIVSLVKNGKKVLQYSHSSIGLNEVAFKSGVQRLYGIFTTGILSQKEVNKFSFGYGFGTEFKLNKWLDLNFEQHVKRIQFNRREGGKYWLRFGTNLNFSITKNFGITTGANYNYFFNNNLINFDESDLVHRLSNNAWIDYNFGLQIKL